MISAASIGPVAVAVDAFDAAVANGDRALEIAIGGQNPPFLISVSMLVLLKLPFRAAAACAGEACQALAHEGLRDPLGDEDDPAGLAALRPGVESEGGMKELLHRLHNDWLLAADDAEYALDAKQVLAMRDDQRVGQAATCSSCSGSSKARLR